MNNIHIYHPLFDYRDKEFISSPYGKRDGGDGFHDGLDIKAPRGTQIRVVSEGRVVRVVYNHDVYGNYIVVEHNGFCTLYAHLNSISVTEGAYVTSRMVIGTVGTTGKSSGNHLHFEIRNTTYNSTTFWNSEQGKYKNSVNPEHYLPPVWKENTMIQAYNLGLITSFQHKPTEPIDFGTVLTIIIRLVGKLQLIIKP